MLMSHIRPHLNVWWFYLAKHIARHPIDSIMSFKITILWNKCTLEFRLQMKADLSRHFIEVREPHLSFIACFNIEPDQST